tara:strand:- start:1690 stop:1911 length:222 start_codon:yes stop_codon:yes gene_type:complete
MQEPTPDELIESIQDLKSYRDRLRKEIISISQKLRIPNKKIISSLENHIELKKLNECIEQLLAQKQSQINSRN